MLHKRYENAQENSGRKLRRSEIVTVEELIEKLKEMPKHKKVELGTLDTSCGLAMRVIEYEKYVEIESDLSLM